MSLQRRGDFIFQGQHVFPTLQQPALLQLYNESNRHRPKPASYTGCEESLLLMWYKRGQFLQQFVVERIPRAEIWGEEEGEEETYGCCVGQITKKIQKSIQIIF